jgi:hypothetical protein
MTAQRRLVYTVAELAAFLGWAENTIRREVKDGRLRARKRRSETVILDADLLAYLDGLEAIETAARVHIEPLTGPLPIRQQASPRARVQRLVSILPQQEASR